MYICIFVPCVDHYDIVALEDTLKQILQVGRSSLHVSNCSSCHVNAKTICLTALHRASHFAQARYLSELENSIVIKIDTPFCWSGLLS
mmetsp:Transcript_12974/g.23477  ORF Transcript_12974/g.23477 Transcript_12974/m.23477 type:complete len:88 (-) Transcript_12974:422-685(-)